MSGCGGGGMGGGCGGGGCMGCGMNCCPEQVHHLFFLTSSSPLTSSHVLSPPLTTSSHVLSPPLTSSSSFHLLLPPLILLSLSRAAE